MLSHFTINVTIDSKDEVKFKHEFRTLAAKYMAMAPPEGFFGAMSEKEKTYERDKKLEENAQPKSGKELKIHNDFENIKIHTWKKYGFKRNIVGESFNDDPDEGHSLHKIIGFQSGNTIDPIVTINEAGVRMKWTIDQVCIFLGMPRGIAFEECSSEEDEKKDKKDEKGGEGDVNNAGDDSDSSSSSCIEIVAAANTTYRDPNAPPKPEKPRKKTPEEIREEMMETKRKIIAQHPNFKYTAEDELDDEPQKKKKGKAKTETKFSPADLVGLDNEALSKQYGFSENVVGKTFNNPTEVKKAERIFTILGFDTKKIKYPVIVQYTKTKKIEYYTPEQVREYFKNPISTDKKI